MSGCPVSSAGIEVSVYVFIRNGERYTLIFDAGREEEAMQAIGRWADNPELSFSWRDAARLANKIRWEEGKCDEC